MTQKELQDTVIVTGWKSTYIAKKNKSKDFKKWEKARSRL